MKKVLLIGILLIAFFEFSHSEIHHKVKIKFDSKVNNSNIFEYCSDILSVKKDLFVIAILDDKELSKLKFNNLNFE